MSLILTTNTSTNDGSSALNTGVSRPYDYRNFLTDTFDIEANSEVAVQSVKFCREGEISLNQRNCEFYVFQGDNTPQANDVDDNEVMKLRWTTSAPVLTRLNNELDKNELYTPSSMAKQIQKGIASGMNHPDMVLNGNTNVKLAGDAGGVQVQVARETDQEFKGFSIDINYGRSASITANSRSSSAFTDAYDNDQWLGSWSGVTSKITKDAGKTCEMIDTYAPICQLNGSFATSFKNAGVGWSIGLTRYLDITQFSPVNGLQQPSYASNLNESWYDWVAKSVLDPDDGLYYFRLYHNIVDPDNSDGDTLRLVEFEYWTYGPGAGSFSGPFETYATAGGYTDIKNQQVHWNIKNERVSCVLQDGEGEEITLCNGADGDKEDNMKPVCSTTKYLYPKVQVDQDTAYVEVLDMRHSRPLYPTFVYGLNRTTTAIAQQGNVTQDYDYYCRLKLGGIEDTWAQKIDTRYMFNYEDVESGPTADGNYVQLAMATNGTLNASETNGSGLGLCIIQTPNHVKGKGVDEWLGYGGDLASVGDMFGFNNKSLLLTPTSQTSYIENWTSWSVPPMVSSNSIFIRLNNFTQTTINGQTNGISKILYHMPRFDNAGSEFGGLFFEPTERTYIKLRNITSIKCNEFNLSIVNSDETLATSITGKTIIMLHIRKSKY